MGLTIIEKMEQNYYQEGALVLGPYFVDVSVVSVASSSKDSVDEGSFRPGDFRINPYTVSKSANESTETSFTWWKWLNEATNTYMENSLKGQIGLFGATDPGFQWGNEATRKANVLQKAQAKLGKSELSLGVEFGELKETFQTLRDPLKALRTWFLGDKSYNLRRFSMLRDTISKKRGLVNLGQDSADTLLEIRYGLRPIISSIQAIMEHAASQAKALDPQRIRSVGSKITDEQTGVKTEKYLIKYDLGDGSTPGGIKYVTTSEAKRVYRAKVYYRRLLESSSLQDWGLSPEHIPEIVWELTRLSFVVDWIFSVGPWLGSYRVKPGIEILGNTVSTRTTVTAKATPIWVPDRDWMVKNLSGGIGTFYEQSYVRECDEDLSKTPLFRYSDAVSLWHIIDGLALTMQPLWKSLRKATR